MPSNPPAPIETRQLLLRVPRLSDAPDLFRFMGDAAAMRHTHRLADLRELRRQIAAYEHSRGRVGCAPWTVLDKADGRIVGWGGLYEDPFDRNWGIEVGYFFDPSVWGRGFATELTLAALAVARRLALAEVWAFSRPENLGSRRVLEKAGFAVERFVPEMERHLYRCPLPPPG